MTVFLHFFREFNRLRHVKRAGQMTQSSLKDRPPARGRTGLPTRLCAVILR
jgi:hypothetical protein